MIKQTIIRLIPFRLRTPLRALYHSLKYRIGVLVGGRDPLIPPDSLHSVGPGHYVAVGFAELMGIATGYQGSRALTVATELGIADLLRGGPRPVGDLALATGTHEPTLYRLLRALASVGVFHEDNERCFSLTPMGQLLRSDALTSVGAVARFVGRDYHWTAWGHLLHSVRTGENASRAALGTDVWTYRERHPEENEIFNAAMAALSRAGAGPELVAYDYGRHRIIADIAGGTGVLLSAILRKHPESRGILFDQPHVVAAARTILEREGVADRVRIESGSFFERVPSGADAYVMRRTLHNWLDTEAVAILRCCRAAMRPDARLLLIESVVGPPNADPQSKFSDLGMLVSPGGRERTESEWSALLAEGGFKLHQVHPAGPTAAVIEAWPA
jgi:O-methyltransferase/methyltransferase family protein